MRSGGPLARLHGAAIRVQVVLVLSAIPIVAALYGIALAPYVVHLALQEQPRATIDAAQAAVTVVVVLLVVCVAIATAAASMLLRGSLRAVVERLHAATGAIADGDFTHRIDSIRDDELGRLAGAIDTMATRLERLEQARRRLLACVSHELRTPLTIIQGHAYTLGRSEADTARLERLDMMQAEAVRLAALVDDLVEAASLHAGSVRLSVEPADLTQLAREACERFVEPALARGIGVKCSFDRRRAVAHVDPRRIEQVLANLLSNAVRHATPGTDVVVEVRTRRAGGGTLELEVRNVGRGIETDIEVFEPFVQGSAAPGRVGLGLTIARGLVNAHGGELVCAQTPQGDATCVSFVFTLPRAGARNVAPASTRGAVVRQAVVLGRRPISPVVASVEP